KDGDGRCFVAAVHGLDHGVETRKQVGRGKRIGQQIDAAALTLFFGGQDGIGHGQDEGEIRPVRGDEDSALYSLRSMRPARCAWRPARTACFMASANSMGWRA